MNPPSYRSAAEILGGNEVLEEVISREESRLATMTRDLKPLQWAATQNNLGAALQSLGARESGTARLEEAVAAYAPCRSLPGSVRRWSGPQPRII